MLARKRDGSRWLGVAHGEEWKIAASRRDFGWRCSSARLPAARGDFGVRLLGKACGLEIERSRSWRCRVAEAQKRERENSWRRGDFAKARLFDKAQKRKARGGARRFCVGGSFRRWVLAVGFVGVGFDGGFLGVVFGGGCLRVVLPFVWDVTTFYNFLNFKSDYIRIKG